MSSSIKDNVSVCQSEQTLFKSSVDGNKSHKDISLFFAKFRQILYKITENDNSQTKTALIKAISKYNLDNISLPENTKVFDSLSSISHQTKLSKLLDKEIEKTDKQLKQKNDKGNLYTKLKLLQQLKSNFTSITVYINEKTFNSVTNKDTINFNKALDHLDQMTKTSEGKKNIAKYFLNKDDKKDLVKELLKSNNKNSITKLFNILKKTELNENEIQSIFTKQNISDVIQSIQNNGLIKESNIHTYVKEIFNLSISENAKKTIFVSNFLNKNIVTSQKIIDAFIEGGENVKDMKAIDLFVESFTSIHLPQKIENQILIFMFSSSEFPNKNILNQLLEIENGELATQSLKLFFDVINNKTKLDDKQLHSIFNVKDNNAESVIYNIFNKNYNTVAAEFLNGISKSRLNPETRYKFFNPIDKNGSTGFFASLQKWSVDNINSFFKFILNCLDEMNITKNEKKNIILDILSAKNLKGEPGIFAAFNENNSSVLEKFFTVLHQNNYFSLNKKDIFKLLQAKNNKNETGLYVAFKNKNLKVIKTFLQFIDINSENSPLNIKDKIELIQGINERGQSIFEVNENKNNSAKDNSNIFIEYVDAILRMNFLTIRQKKEILGKKNVNVFERRIKIIERLNRLKEIVESPVEESIKLALILEQSEGDQSLLKILLKNNDHNSIKQFFDIIKKESTGNAIQICFDAVNEAAIGDHLKKNIIFTNFLNLEHNQTPLQIIEIFINGEDNENNLFIVHSILKQIIDSSYPQKIKNKIIARLFVSKRISHKNIFNQLLKSDSTKAKSIIIDVFKQLNKYRLSDDELFDIFDVKDKGRSCLYTCINSKSRENISTFLNNLNKFYPDLCHQIVSNMNTGSETFIEKALSAWGSTHTSKMFTLIREILNPEKK